ncbi:Sua5/YciO/YrdC/YwlC family protein [bacterium]|nr:Sua5/YciO/YrdC/YwlC family protein [bacterium]
MKARWRWLDDDPEGAITEAVTELAREACIVFPTDTVYGLLASVASRQAYEQVFQIKHRPLSKPLALLVSTKHQLNAAVQRLLQTFTAAGRDFNAGHLTLIVADDLLPAGALPGEIGAIQPGPVGVRCPADAALQLLLEKLGGLVWATSVNLTGQPPVASAAQLQLWTAALGKVQPAVIVASRSELTGTPSRLAMLQAGKLSHLDRS